LLTAVAAALTLFIQPTLFTHCNAGQQTNLQSGMKLLPKLKEQASRLKRELHALWLAYSDPRTPWLARLLIACIIAYALSPIDLIPDPIPIIGHVDDLND